MAIDQRRVIELLNGADDVLILTHKNPDGDTLGCGVALYHVLTAMGKRARVLNGDVIPDRYSYLFEDVETLEFEPKFIVAVDVADNKLFGEELDALYGDKVDLCIDHHGTNVDYAKETFLNADDGAASLTLYRVFVEMGAEITPAIAAALYTGISTDTGCFRYSNTTPEALRVCADLIDAGADSAAINVAMFETKPFEYYDLLSEVLGSMRVFCEGKVVVFKVTNKMLEKTGATLDQCDSISAISRQFEGALCGITMKEKQDGGYKFSLRTHEPLDASALCAEFGGGGHMRAAGCDAPEGREEETLNELVALIEKELK
ncbi:MAG: bifunctional oligoribonuclease/PAP phosphatase NrnA [Clostridia bacterium]|nr:bifunctional oligoribonuclease/PAP phosphatase NrnA [Clostridia bacterium]MBR5976314.1 bifunctional oligoribonuclease/PAP phosphatase NrnA [Clostridia bacterium]MBR5991869.1 bifunctional oligoribonuclease/PAP phosphatase NrnA [Clostridia bacterium]MBR6478919.1 bifunctional oligoribonuclease/PAP phosphatase NrnA [Clostridia bacterium]